jgi:hypothetical protein
VAKWQGKGLQNPHQGFKSPRRLSYEMNKHSVKNGLLQAIFCIQIGLFFAFLLIHAALEYTHKKYRQSFTALVVPAPVLLSTFVF